LKSVFVTLLFLIALTSDAQYVKLTRGQPNPFDTAVAVRIDRYRAEGLKFKLADSLIDSLILEIKMLHTEVKLADNLAAMDRITVATLTKSIERKDSVNRVVTTEFNRLFGLIEEEKIWYKRPEYFVGALIILEVFKLLISGK